MKYEYSPLPNAKNSAKPFINLLLNEKTNKIVLVRPIIIMMPEIEYCRAKNVLYV